MWLKWLPWRFVIRRMAGAGGFLDPVAVFSQLQRFTQPSEVAYPVEILRLAAVLHARGLINSQAIQHNLDWVWPYWVERQFDPRDRAFVPRAFSITHINLTHRNWTAIGLPGCNELPIVDPAGLLTPFFDGWSLDCWIIPESGAPLIPSRFSLSSQELSMHGNLAVVTQTSHHSLDLTCRAEVMGQAEFPVCRLNVAAKADREAWLVLALRPYNPEGISFIHKIEMLGDHKGWSVNGTETVHVSPSAERCAFSDYPSGDVYRLLPHVHHKQNIVCDVGLASAAFLYQLRPGVGREIEVEIPLKDSLVKKPPKYKPVQEPSELWEQNLEGVCQLKMPDAHIKFLYEAAIRTLVLHSPRDIYPGPYTYKHFWFRDAAFALYAMLCVGLSKKAEKVIDQSFFHRQTPFGYFHSQDGEWDSNGEALWTMQKFCQLTGQHPKKAWREAIKKAASWIEKKRLKKKEDCLHAGLFPAGFSAEHLGPSDYYYWDDFWGVAGLKAAAFLLSSHGKTKTRDHFESLGKEFLQCIEDSLSLVAKKLERAAMPASPYRRMDSGAIGSIVCGYPLKIFAPEDPRLAASLEYIVGQCFVDGGFFHDMGHSGINPYLTLHIAQNFLRAGDERYFDAMQRVAELASPTGQWPEAIHPATLGGCMGDGQHVWAAAEWILMVRNCFLREEEDQLILCSGISSSWLEAGGEISFGPAPTEFGIVSVSLRCEEKRVRISWKGDWYQESPKIEVRLPSHEVIYPSAGEKAVEISLCPLT